MYKYLKNDTCRSAQNPGEHLPPCRPLSTAVLHNRFCYAMDFSRSRYHKKCFGLIISLSVEQNFVVKL